MRRVYLFSLGLAVFSGACAAQSDAPAGLVEPGAAEQTELDVAFDHYQAERYKEAADAFARAYEQSGDSSALAGQAQSLQQAGQCHEAAVLYERFLELEPDPTYNNAIRSMLERCTAR
jgi:TolA-binding protein